MKEDYQISMSITLNGTLLAKGKVKTTPKTMGKDAIELCDFIVLNVRDPSLLRKVLDSGGKLK